MTFVLSVPTDLPKPKLKVGQVPYNTAFTHESQAAKNVQIIRSTQTNSMYK